MSKISIAQPVFNGREREYVLDCLESTRISSTGFYIDRFEDELARFCRTTDAITCTNGTAALHLALKALGVGPGDEVIVPSLTYVAAANAVTYCGAQPVFADVTSDSGTICCNEVARLITNRTRGIVAVHLYGDPADLDPLLEIATRHSLFVLEDAAEAIGAEYENRRVGSFGVAGIFSFYGNKIITSGEGGAVVTSDRQLATKLRQLRGQGVDPDRAYWHPVIGFNYRMSNLLAAVALAQLENIKWQQLRRSEITSWYEDNLRSSADRLALVKERPNRQRALWLYLVKLRNGDAFERDRLIDLLADDGIETRPVFHPMHMLPPYMVPGVSLPESEKWSETGLCLPLHGALFREDVDFISQRLCHHLKAMDNQ